MWVRSPSVVYRNVLKNVKFLFCWTNYLGWSAHRARFPTDQRFRFEFPEIPLWMGHHFQVQWILLVFPKSPNKRTTLFEVYPNFRNFRSIRFCSRNLRSFRNSVVSTWEIQQFSNSLETFSGKFLSIRFHSEISEIFGRMESVPYLTALWQAFFKVNEFA